MFFSWGQLCPLVDLWRPFLLLSLGRCYWHLVDQDQGCCYILQCKGQHPPTTTTTKDYPIQNVNSAKIEKLYPSYSQEQNCPFSWPLEVWNKYLTIAKMAFQVSYSQPMEILVIL